MDYYVLMPSLILHLITGEWVTDTTMAGTSMLTDVRNRTFSAEILGKLGLSPAIFPPMVEPGKIIGKTTREASEKLGIKTGIDVVVSGHDTQFAIVGSGAGLYQPVLSSGTWEILMVRAGTGQLHIPSRESGVTIELDSQPGFVNIGVQWVASGVLEWIGKMLYSDLAVEESRYQTMILEAIAIPAGSNGITMIPELFPGGFSGRPGSIHGFTHDTTRGHIYRACLEALSFYSCYGLDLLQQAGNCPAQSIVCVGGGSKNPLWNQIRADVLDVPLKIPDIKETTAVGAAMVALAGIGVYSDLEEALAAMDITHVEYKPGKDRDRYRELYLKYLDNVLKAGNHI
jgi:L-fuculokinase